MSQKKVWGEVTRGQELAIFSHLDVYFACFYSHLKELKFGGHLKELNCSVPPPLTYQAQNILNAFILGLYVLSDLAKEMS